jgi:hypothetical protein
LNRADLEARWLTLTREIMPGIAAEKRWPIRNDHCFQRVLLDNACGGTWYAYISKRPAYRRADAATLERAIALGEAVLAGSADLTELNNRSLVYRGKA